MISILKIRLLINKYIDKLIYLLPKDKHEKLYHFTRTKYGKKYYGKEGHDEEVIFNKCYWFPRIALTYLNKYTKYELEINEDEIRRRFPLYYAKPRRRN